MNDMLKGFRGLITAWSALILGNIDVITEAVQKIAEIVNVQLSESGAVTALVAAAISIKLAITDAWPKLSGGR